MYHLVKQELAKKLVAGSSPVTSLALHGSGDHLLVGMQARPGPPPPPPRGPAHPHTPRRCCEAAQGGCFLVKRSQHAAAVQAVGLSR